MGMAGPGEGRSPITILPNEHCGASAGVHAREKVVSGFGGVRSRRGTHPPVRHDRRRCQAEPCGGSRGARCRQSRSRLSCPGATRATELKQIVAPASASQSYTYRPFLAVDRPVRSVGQWVQDNFKTHQFVRWFRPADTCDVTAPERRPVCTH